MARPPRFTREEIAAAALELVEAHGLEALSMRELAARLGVGTMSLYRYFDTKDALLDAVTEAAMPDFTAPRRDAADWRRELRRVFADLRRGLERHPALVRMRFERLPRTERALDWTEAVLQLLQHAGFTRAQAVGGYRALYTYTYGFVAFAAAETRAQARVATELRALPSDRYPAIVGSAGELAKTLGSERQYEFGLRRLIVGLDELVGE